MNVQTLPYNPSQLSGLKVSAKEFIPSSFKFGFDLMGRLTTQINFLFSDANLHYDSNFANKLWQYSGMLPVEELLQIPQILQVSCDLSLIKKAVLNSSFIEFTPSGTHIQRRDWAKSQQKQQFPNQKNFGPKGNYQHFSSSIHFKENQSSNNFNKDFNEESIGKRKRSSSPTNSSVSSKRPLLSLKLQAQQNRKHEPIRQPKGPDGTKGFSQEYRNSRTTASS